MACCDHKNPLQRGGTSQQERLLPALKPSSASVDEHRFEDWITFAAEFARFLHYFDAADQKTGDWSPFFQSDISVQLGSIAIQDIDQYRQDIKKQFDFLKSDDHKADTAGLEKALNNLFSILLTLSKAMDETLLRLPDTVVLKNTLANLVQTKLSLSLYRLLGYYKAAKEAPLLFLDEGIGEGQHPVLNQQIMEAATIINGKGLSNRWWVVQSGASLLNYEWLRNNAASVPNAAVLLSGITNWNDYVASVPANNSIFASALADSAATDAEKEYLRLQHAANHNLFSSIFDQYLFAYTKLISDASGELEKTLTSWNSHQPHLALFLGFLKLFKFVQQESNTLTRRHLDFYYRDVLRLRPKEAVPGKAHVVVELAKQVEHYLLAKGTQLKAGKDSKGKDVVYALDNDTTFNKAKVASLRSVYFGGAGDNIPDPSTTTGATISLAGHLFASPVANSSDGLGAALKTPTKEWHPFASKDYSEGALVKLAMPRAAIGFAVASHYLFLAEGERKVTVKLVSANAAPANGKAVDCYLTTEKGWYTLRSSLLGSPSGLSILFTLPGDAPPIVAYNAAVHGGSFACDVPVLKVVLPADDKLAYSYEALKNIAITAVEVKVDVGIENTYTKKGLKQLSLSNDFGPIDPAKPFMPFGAQPKKDSTLVIGNKEVFTKKNAGITLNIEWADLPADKKVIKYDKNNLENVPTVAVSYLSGNVWTNTALTTTSILSGAEVAVPVFTNTQPLPAGGVAAYDEPYLPFGSESKRGFLRLRLNEDFGHKAYLNDLALYMIAKATTPATAGNQPVEPYTPVIQSLFLSYTASQVGQLQDLNATNFAQRELRFFHLYPFGEAEQHQYLNAVNKIAEPICLLPQFRHGSGADTAFHTGEFYIGLDNLHADDAVNLLFQVMEGSSDPQLTKALITWSYLSNNHWREFLSQQISDSTLGLLQSGIVSFAIPSDATTNNTVLPSGKLWLRAAISDPAEAVPKFLSVEAQAAASTLQPNNNAPDVFAASLPAGTLSKLKTPDAAIRKISQPYNSFGGRPQESEDHFYMRASERLRHKGRAITIWDYERLILEAFPEIYRVKCLNHTGVVKDKTDPTKEITNELLPGHVLIVTIPLLQNRNDVDPLKPYTRQDTLTRIKNFLAERVSCFVTVDARQPLFEEVGVSFKLKLYEQYKDFTVYANQLQEEIVQYLTPWAFNSDADVPFGGTVYKSSLINFIEERYYVDYVTDVALTHNVGGAIVQDPQLEEIAASTGRSILVSLPASKHKIGPVEETASVTAAECAAATFV